MPKSNDWIRFSTDFSRSWFIDVFSIQESQNHSEISGKLNRTALPLDILKQQTHDMVCFVD